MMARRNGEGRFRGPLRCFRYGWRLPRRVDLDLLVAVAARVPDHVHPRARVRHLDADPGGLEVVCERSPGSTPSTSSGCRRTRAAPGSDGNVVSAPLCVSVIGGVPWFANAESYDWMRGRTVAPLSPQRMISGWASTGGSRPRPDGRRRCCWRTACSSTRSRCRSGTGSARSTSGRVPPKLYGDVGRYCRSRRSELVRSRCTAGSRRCRRCGTPCVSVPVVTRNPPPASNVPAGRPSRRRRAADR